MALKLFLGMLSMVFNMSSARNSTVIAEFTTKFTDETDKRGVGDTGQSFAVAFADVDADGDLDMFITNSGSSNRMYMNTDGKGTFTDTAAQAGLDDEGSSRGAAFADVNGDGYLDLYVTDASVANHLYIGDGTGKFTDKTVIAGVGDVGMGQGACFADVDNDGDLDLFVANFGQSNNLYLNSGKGIFENATAKAGLTSTGNSGFGCAFGDIDEDGDLDLYVTNSGQHNKLYVNNGKGVFTDGTSAAGPAVGGGTGQKRAVVFADLNGDGHLDIYYVGPAITNQLLLGDGTGHFIDGTSAAGVGGAGSTGTAQGMNVADVDGDGDLDIFVANIGGLGIAPCKLYENDGKGHFTDVASRAGLDYHFFGQGVAFGDIDGDGDLDMYLENWGIPLYHSNKLLINRANIAAWLKVQPLRQDGRPTLLGTEVRLFEAGSRTPAGARTQIDGGSAFGSQNSYEAYFGLSSSSAKTFDIELRCGGAWVTKDTMPELASVTPNQIVKVKCPKSALADASQHQLAVLV